MRMYVKNNKKVYKKRKLRILIIFFMFLLLSIILITNNLNSFYLNYSIRKAKVIINNSLNNAINSKVLTKMNNNNIYQITKNKKGEIQTINYNTYLVNTYLKEINNNVESKLKEEERQNDNIYFYIPIGAISKNPIFNDKGPKIPVKIEAIGTVFTEVKTIVKDYGINNALIEMHIKIEVEEKIILPLITDTIKITNEIPISYNIIQGVVPNYYGGEITKTSSIYSSLLNK